MCASSVSRALVFIIGMASLAAPMAPTLAQSTGPSFRDTNGRVWTPDNVGQPDNKPVPPEDRAFDPRRQVVTEPGASVQSPRLRVVGSVPITSRPGSATPVVTLNVPTLRLDNRERWVAVLILANNSERVVDAELVCRFSNGQRLVEDTRIFLRGIEPGRRVEGVARGPQGSLFVNNTTCSVVSPLQ